MLPMTAMFCVLSVAFTLTATDATANRAMKNRPNKSPSPGSSFSPCRIAKLTKASVKRLRKLALSVVSTCGLSIVPLVNESWGPPRKVVMFVPRFKFAICCVFRTLYSYFSDSPGRLPRQLAANASTVYDFGNRYMLTVLSDSSLKSSLCVSGRTAHGTEKFCYSRAQLLRLLKLITPCLQKSMHNALPESVDVLIYAMTFIFEASESSGLFEYLSG